MMMWCSCESMMPGERYDSKKYPENKIAKFLICYYFGEKDLINPELEVAEAILIDGKFVAKGSSNGWRDATITHWMLIENP